MFSYNELQLMKHFNFDEDLQNGLHPMTFGDKVNTEDNPTLNKAMYCPNTDRSIEVMKKEIEELE